MEILAVGCGAGVLGFMLGTSAGRSTKSGDSSAPPFKQSVLNMGVDAAHLGLLGIGEEVGYFKALFEGPASSSELAKRAGCDPRYTKEWCLHMASRGVLMYDPTSAAFTLQPHLVEDLKDPNTLGMSYGIPAVLAKRNEHVTAYKTGSGISWNSYDSGLNVCACRFFKPLYENMLVPTLPSEIRKLRDTKVLEAGGSLADVGCGCGISTLVLGKAFPQASFTGVDFCGNAIAEAQNALKQEAMTNVTFITGDAAKFGSPKTFDAVMFLDCFHDMSIATKAAQRAKQVLKDGGQVFLIEPLASYKDDVLEQLKLPTTPMYSAFSCLSCLCTSKCDSGDALGTLCPTETHEEIFVKKAGFKSLELLKGPLVDMGFRQMLVRS